MLDFKKKIEDFKSFTDVENKLKEKELELSEIDEKLSNKKKELELLKKESIELKDYINQNFMEEFKKCDYMVNIKNCYIIEYNGKKYISIREHETEHYEYRYTTLHVEYYTYKDALDVKDMKCSYLFEYRYSHDTQNMLPQKSFGYKPDYEEHILNVCPELSIFSDNKVPNTYLKKIYYEINELGNKTLKK